MIHISLFSGIGGFELASEWAGWKNYASCEINPFGQKVLKYYWPNAYHHDDVKTLTYELLNTQLIQRFGTDWRNDDIIITGGFPCQPYSQAGKRLGKEDDRHLWPEMLRAIREIQPTWVVGENVSGLINWSGGLVFDEVQTDLEAQGYEVQAYVLPACAVNAPHRRDRVWFVAYNKSQRWSEGFGQEVDIQRRKVAEPGSGDSIGFCVSERTITNTTITGREEWKSDDRRENTTQIGSGMDDRPERSCNDGNAPDTGNIELQKGMHKERSGKAKRHTGSCDSRFNQRYDWINFPTQPPVRSRNDGFPTELVRERIRKDSLGLLSEKEIDKIISKAITDHRKESIKAYGNSVIPQLVLQIFKTINEYEKSIHTNEG